MPDLTLPCLDGGRPSRLVELRGPALVNLWASSCAPCRAELPAIQRYAARAAGRVGVLGVVTADRRSAARSVVDDLHLGFGMLEDREGALLRALGRTTIPVTLLVSADGRVVHTYLGTALTETAIDGLVRDHLGVVVAP